MFIVLFTLVYPAQGIAATLYLNDGRIIKTESISQEDGVLKCRISGITIYYKFEDIDRIEGAGLTLQGKHGEDTQKGALSAESSLIKSCYELGYRYGLCAARRHQGIPCEPRNDIVIPERCRGKSETEKGLVAGISEISVASKTHSGPLLESISINLESTPIETLQEYLGGKTKQEVTDLIGKPNRVKHFAGHELWIYGDSSTASDKAVAFEGAIVKAVVLY